MMGIGFELCTDITESEISSILSGNPRDSKMKLAFEITKSVHGEKLATRAQDVFIKTFQKKEIPDEINEIFAEGDLAQTLIKSGLVSSNSDLRRLAEAGAITHLESEKVITLEDVKKAPEKGTYKIGKNRFIKII
jgi:tyrosyl-tRNA synthetase